MQAVALRSPVTIRRGRPLMTCQRCQDEASVHLTETVDGQRRELHLCAACARKAGLALPESPPNLALDAVVQGLIVAHVGELVGELAELTCPDCGLKFMEFRARGRLGCPQRLRRLRARAAPPAPAGPRRDPARRQGGPAAAGRRPSGSGSGPSSATPIAREDYEEAARLRDQLRLKDADA